MSTATSQAPSTPFPSRHHRQADIEPDKAWKDNLYKTIEETLQSMVDDAKRDLDERLAAAGTEEARGLAEEEYHKSMNTIRNLAKESFQAQLNRERQERMWAVKHVKQAEQEDILTRSKKTSLGTTSTNSTTNHSSAANFSTSVPSTLPTSSSFPPRNGPTTIPAAPPRVNDEHSDGNSPRGPDIRNFDPPRPESRRPQPDPSPAKRRSASTEVHSTTIFPSSMTKSPIPPPSPFSPGAPLRPQDPSPTLGIAPINVVARDLPPELAARRDQYSSLSRRGSNAASQAREGYPRPPIPSFSSPKIEKQPQPPPAPPDDHVPTDPEDESPPPSTSRYNPRRTSGSQDRGSDAGPSRSVERPVAYSPSDRIPARSPSNPQMWKPSVSPEEETVPPRTGSGLARRGSTTSIRSTGSGNIRPNIAEAIPEHEHESSERTKESEPPRKRDSHQSRPSDQPVFGPPTRPDSWSEPMLIYEEPNSSHSPPKPSSTSRTQEVMGPPPAPPTRPPSTRKPSYQTDDRDLYQSHRLRNQTSFDDRPFPSPYTPAPPASRPSPRPGADFYEYPRPRDYYPPYSAPLTPDSPYTGEQRSNTWRRATQPESPPTRRSTENNWSTMNREPSYGSKYPRAEDDSPLAYDDHRYHSFEYPSVKYDKYDSHQSSAIPIRQRNPSYNDDINGNGWKTSSAAWGEPVTRPRTSRPREFDDYPTSRGYDYDRDREYRSRDDLWGRDERDYDRDDHRTGYDRGYHGSRYSSEMVHSNSRDSYGPGPRSSPSSYRNEQYRFGGREYRPSFDDEEDDDYLDNPYSREYPDSSRYSRDYHRVRRSNFEREAATARTELFKDIRSHNGKARYLADPSSTGESSLSDDDADDERSRIVTFAREKIPARQKSLRITKKDSGSSTLDRPKRSKEELEREERCRREEEERRRAEEAARRQEEIQQKAREMAKEMERIREEARRIEEEEKRKREEEEARQREEERQEREREEEDRRRREEIAQKKREQEQRKKEEKEARQRRREEERRKREEEDRKRMEEEERQRKEEEALRKEEEATRKEEELRQKEAEARRKEEEIRRKEEEWKRREREAREEARRKEEEFKRKEEESRRKEEEARRKEEEWRRKEQEAKKKEQEAKKKERELRKKEEEAKRKEQELKRKEEEARRKEEEARRREEELEIERKRVEEEREEAKRKEEEAQRREEELRKREEELQRRETEIAARRTQQQAEFRKREEEIRRRKGESYEQEIGWAPSSYGSASSFGGRSTKKEKEEDRLAEEARRREEEQAKQEEEARKEEEAKKAEEAKKEEEDRLRREQEETDRIAAEELQEQLLVEAREEEERRFKEAQHRDAERRKMDEIWRQKQTEQAKRKQQEEYRRQEEQIRQQAEERKRQRSNTHEYANGSSSYHTTSSSPPSWTSSQANSWGASQSSFYSAPRTSTTSYASSFEPKDDGLTDWQRRQEEMYQKQQEQFRKEQERMEAQRRTRDAGRVPTKNEILAIYDNHERLWATMGSKSQLYWKDFPWPMFKTPASPEEITPHTVSAYMQSPHYPETAKVKTYKDRLRDHIRRWHPDRFETQTLPRVVDEQKETVREAAGSVVRALNDLNSRTNNVNDMFA